MEGESQHFLLSASARTLDLKRVARMSEEEAEDAFIALRYVETDGEPFCHHCQCAVVYRITRTVKNRKTGEIRKRRLFKCANCLKQFSATSGTIFASRKLELRDILFAIGLFANGAKGLSALQLSRDLNVQHKTAFVLAHKLREALGALQHAERLAGSVEIDGAYFGGYAKPATRKENRRDRRQLANQTGKRKCVTVMRERGGRTRPFICSELEGAKLAVNVIQPGSILYADESKSYDGLEAIFDTRRIDHSKSYAEGEVSTNHAESYHSRVRRSEQGVHHRIADKLEAYANEMAWREDNRRKSNGEQFLTITAAGLHHPVSRQWKGYWQRRKEAA
ncbi:IS1595 family transposase [Sphingopyxis sp.]|uniref:IS1595 family transposase n=1 Tax=Sphingopyxis sp. TaxID=1908224 RepID=UPI002DFA7D2F|nr:IS1595 family transposase [Sphingopyxis sp.]